MNDVCNLSICIHIFFSFISFTLFRRVSIENRHEQCFENARFPKRKMVFLSSSNAIQHEKKRKSWKINSSWRDCLFSFLFEFQPHCVWLKMIMKCKLFEILTRHLFQNKKKTLCVHSESHFVNERKTLTAFNGNAIIFHHRTIWIGCSLLFRNEFLFYRIFA